MPRGCRDRGNTHPVDGQALEDPARAAGGELDFRLRARQLLLEDLHRARGVGAGEPWYPDP